jgi:heme/copper-type cytochrome/quinol oxidase subunit 2
MEYNYYLDKDFTIFNMKTSITTAKVDAYMSHGLTMAAIICGLMLYFAAVVYYPYSQNIEYDLGNEAILLRVASIVQFIIAMTYFFLWIMSHMKLAVQKYERKKLEAEEGVEVESKLMTILFKIPGIKNAYCLK